MNKSIKKNILKRAERLDVLILRERLLLLFTIGLALFVLWKVILFGNTYHSGDERIKVDIICLKKMAVLKDII